jgi:hypothetical protein
VLDRVYGAVAWQRVDEIRYNMEKLTVGITVKEVTTKQEGNMRSEDHLPVYGITSRRQMSEMSLKLHIKRAKNE